LIYQKTYKHSVNLLKLFISFGESYRFGCANLGGVSRMAK